MAQHQSPFAWAPDASGEAEHDAPKSSRPKRTPAAGSASPWLTAHQAAEYLGLPSVRALYKRIERASVPADAVRRWGRQFRFRREALDAFMGRHG